MEDANLAVLPTRFKAKISHELSFPIGAEKISNALTDTPQFQKLALHFNSDRWRDTSFHRYACVGVDRSSRRADMAERFLDTAGIPLFNEWRVDVYPVPRAHRHRIQQFIINTALPEIRNWLWKREEVQPGEESLRFFFDEQKDEFTPEIKMRLQPRR